MEARLFPVSSSSSVYRDQEQNKGTVSSSYAISGADIFLREDILFVHPADTTSNEVPVSVDSFTVSNSGSGDDIEDKWLADALGYTNTFKVLNYATPTKSSAGNRNSAGSSGGSSLDLAGPLLSTTPPHQVASILNKETKYHAVERKQPLSLEATNILQAPGLRNDYYSNLVSWSSNTQRIAIGLGIRVYWWGLDNKVELVPLKNDELITCVSVCTQGMLLVTVMDGTIFLVDEVRNKVMDQYHNPSGCVFCLRWKQKSKVFFAGDETGVVSIFKVHKHEIKLMTTIKCVQQQICAITLNGNGTEMAVGANNNCCMIWDVSDVHKPVRKFVLAHNAAVKAIAYCPWSTSLLATGGGSRDRKIRFWHTASGTLLSEHDTNAQVTAINWCSYRKEVVATFGFATSGAVCETSSSLLCVYSYPSMVPLREVPSVPNIRILSASLDAACTSLVVAANDYTIRIYKLWKKGLHLAPSLPSTGDGLYRSSLIDLYEGIANRGDIIR